MTVSLTARDIRHEGGAKILQGAVLDEHPLHLKPLPRTASRADAVE